MPGYWLFKTEPDVFGIDELKAQKKAIWDGVRNYAARNYLRDKVAKGDTVFLYHSSCPEPGIAGQALVSKAGFPDSSAFDRKHKYFDAKSDPLAPRWFSVEVSFKAKAGALIPLLWLREDPVCKGMETFRLNRLSISQVSPAQAERILGLPAWGAKKGST